jgi:5-methylthioadenosine/S-adenosylhomocysteine deaminase
VAAPLTLVVSGCDALVRPGEIHESVDLVISGNTITAVEPTRSREAERTIDGRGLLALPGLVNAHSHSPEHCLRGAGEGLPLEVWLARMFGTSGPFAPDDHYASALAGALEMLLTGTTAVVDHLWMTPPTLEAAEATLRAYRDIGLRAAVAPLVLDHDYTGGLADDYGFDLSGALMTDWTGAPPPVAEQQAQLEELMRGWHGAADGRLQVFAGPCGIQWCTDELLVALGETVQRYDSCMHLHALESPLQVPVCRHKYGIGALQGLDKLGLLGPRCSLAHSVHLDDDDVELVADRGAVVVHNPAANFRLGSGRAPVFDLLRAGVTVALGSDGTASSDNAIVWQQLKLAALVHNDGFDRWVGSAEALTMATQGGAAALGLAGRLGTLDPGALADVVLVERLHDGLQGALDLEAGLVLSETGRAVRHVIVDGRVVVEGRRCVTVDERAVREAVATQRTRRAPAHAHPPPETLAAMDKLDRFRRLVLGHYAH